ncbi:MAG: hypothetical protein Q4G70_09165 [Pseudomonadota bacterium]|nr:hypothetical protein [Pseudomonadota bacterium]
MSAESPSPAKPSIDVRTLSLTQLQKLAERGSRRAKAELENRMRAAAAVAPPPSTAPTPRPPATPPRPLPPLLAEHAAMAPTVRPLSPPPADDAAPAGPSAALVEQLELIARQDEARARADGPPRLVGMLLIGWGVLLTLGGLVMLGHGGGPYYLFCGLGSAAVGWLLMQCSRWAMVLHGVLLLVGLAWAWRTGKAGLLMAFIQAAPLWVSALWMAIHQVREPLE